MFPISFMLSAVLRWFGLKGWYRILRPGESLKPQGKRQRFYRDLVHGYESTASHFLVLTWLIWGRDSCWTLPLPIILQTLFFNASEKPWVENICRCRLTNIGHSSPGCSLPCLQRSWCKGDITSGWLATRIAQYRIAESIVTKPDRAGGCSWVS